MPFLDSILHKAREHRQTIVLAEGEDARIIEAARRAQDDGIAKCILIGNPDTIHERAATAGCRLDDISIEDPRASQYHQSRNNFV